MPEKSYQFKAEEDGCLYIFDFTKEKWMRLSDIDKRDVPFSVKLSVKENIEELELLKKIKL